MSCSLSICSYNCNGLERVRQYARGDNTHAGILEALGAGKIRPSPVQAADSLGGLLTVVPYCANADIVCFQETKMSHADLWPTAFSRIADVPGW